MFHNNARASDLNHSILIAMGIVHLPSIRDYWSTDPAKSGRKMSFFAEAMAGNCFEQMYRYLHLADESKEDNQDMITLQG